MTSAVPLGRGFSASLSRHFVPGYYGAVPPGHKATRPSKRLAKSYRLLAFLSFSFGATRNLQTSQG